MRPLGFITITWREPKKRKRRLELKERRKTRKRKKSKNWESCKRRLQTSSPRSMLSEPREPSRRVRDKKEKRKEEKENTKWKYSKHASKRSTRDRPKLAKWIWNWLLLRLPNPSAQESAKKQQNQSTKRASNVATDLHSYMAEHSNNRYFSHNGRRDSTVDGVVLGWGTVVLWNRT